MCNTLLAVAPVLRRHWDVLLAAQRTAYLRDPVSRGLAPSTLRIRARHCLLSSLASRSSNFTGRACFLSNPRMTA